MSITNLQQAVEVDQLHFHLPRLLPSQYPHRPRLRHHLLQYNQNYLHRDLHYKPKQFKRYLHTPKHYSGTVTYVS